MNPVDEKLMSKNFRAATMALALLAGACGSSGVETVTGTVPSTGGSPTTTAAAPSVPATSPIVPGVLIYAPDGETLFSTTCEAVDQFVLTPYEEGNEEDLLVVFPRLKAVVANDDPELAADIDWVSELVNGDTMSEEDEAEALDILLPIDRGTYELCGVPLLSALEHVVNSRFCNPGFEAADPPEDGAGQAPPPDDAEPDECGPIWATSVPCFDSVPRPEDDFPFEYTPVDCDTGEELTLDVDGEWISAGVVPRVGAAEAAAAEPA